LRGIGDLALLRAFRPILGPGRRRSPGYSHYGGHKDEGQQPTKDLAAVAMGWGETGHGLLFLSRTGLQNGLIRPGGPTPGRWATLQAAAGGAGPVPGPRRRDRCPGKPAKPGCGTTSRPSRPPIRPAAPPR